MSIPDLSRLVGEDFSLQEFMERIPMIGASVEKVEDEEIAVEFFPDRPDLFCVEGVARAYRAFTGKEPERDLSRTMKVEGDSGMELEVDPGMLDVRPVIGAAYITGKAAANTAVFNGISAAAFRKHYMPVCRELDRDNALGKFIFSATSIIQKSALLKGGMLGMVIAEQKRKREKRRMSSVLWDTFTGSAAYRDIFLRCLNPLVIVSLIWNIIASMFKLIFKKNEKQQVRPALP